MDDPRDELIYAAVRLFQDKGYKNTSVQEIVDAVNKSKYSFYHIFTDKEEVLYLIHERLINRLLADGEDALQQDLPAVTKLQRIVANIMYNMQHYRPDLAVFLAEINSLSGERLAVVQAKRDRYFEIVREIMADGIGSGQLQTDVPPTFAALGLLGMCNWMFTWFDPDGAIPAEQIGRMFLQLFLDGASGGQPVGRARVPLSGASADNAGGMLLLCGLEHPAAVPLARALAQRRPGLVLAGVPTAAQRLADALASAGEVAQVVPWAEAEAEALLDTVVQHWGPLRQLICLVSEVHPVLPTVAAGPTFAAGLVVLEALLAAAVKRMAAHEGGLVTVVVHPQEASSPAGAATEAAVRALVRQLTLQYRTARVHICAVLPGNGGGSGTWSSEQTALVLAALGLPGGRWSSGAVIDLA